MKIEEFHHHAHEFSDWMSAYLENVETHPVRSQVQPGDISQNLKLACPEAGESMSSIFDDFKNHILPGITHWQHPRFFAYFNANSSKPSVLAEMLTATLASQCMLWETSPAATELEERMAEWLAQLCGLPKDWSGSIQDSGSASNLCAILAACNYATKGRFANEGFAGGPKPVLYTSEQAHSSVEKGARIAGIGANNVRKIPVRADYGMDPIALGHFIEEDLKAGNLPIGIIASFGATGLGSVDPLSEIGSIARKHDIHLHLDGAWAGSALILPEVRRDLKGLHFVDSFVFNPHKWLFTNFDCSMFYMKDPDRLTGAMSLTPTYLESDSSGSRAEFRDWSIALGRRFRALKLWFVLRSFGAEGLREKLRNHIAWTKNLAQLIQKTGQFELTTDPFLAILTFRYAPEWAKGEDEIDAVNEVLLKLINDDGYLYLSKAKAGNKTVIRFVIGQTETREQHIISSWDKVVIIAATLTPNNIQKLGN